MTFRARVWSDGKSSQVDQFAALLLSFAPHEPGRLKLGTPPQDPNYVESLGGLVARDQLHETLRRCESDNLQMYWLTLSSDTVLEVIAELYDDHIELLARPPVAGDVERAIAEIEGGAS